MSRKTSTRVAQVTGCFPLPVNHSRRISLLISSASLQCLRAILLTLDPFLSSRRKVPNWTYFVAISTGMLITLPSVHGKFSSCCSVSSEPGVHVLVRQQRQNRLRCSIVGTTVTAWWCQVRFCRYVDCGDWLSQQLLYSGLVSLSRMVTTIISYIACIRINYICIDILKWECNKKVIMGHNTRVPMHW